jgi:REP element-mobilizing transposase RayT
MTRWRPDFNADHLYFITSTAVGQMHLFRRDVIKRILVDNLNVSRILGRIQLFAFVIMPNHAHLIVRCTEDHPVSSFLRDFKSNTAKQIIWQYQAERNNQVLDRLRAAAQDVEKQTFRVWDDDYVAKGIFTAAFLRQKLNYVHRNPLQPQWDLVDRPEDYVWSSARFYVLDAHPLIPVSDVRELLA